MFTSKVKEYVIDLRKSEDKRWEEVIEEERFTAMAIAKRAILEIEEYCPKPLLSIGLWAMEKMYHVFGGRYRGEIEAWARAIGMNPALLTAANCSYELSHVFGGTAPYGCTAGVVYSGSRLGLIHARNMDWPLEGIGVATRVFKFVGGRHEFVTVGVPGFVGVLSGMVPMYYSATLNWAPPDGLPSFDFGPAFLLREVMEHCRDYGDALRMLRHTKLAAPAMFMLSSPLTCAAVYRTKRAARVISSGTINTSFTSPMTLTNHFVDGTDMIKYNAGVDVEYSVSRSRKLDSELRKVRGKNRSMAEIRLCLTRSPVGNDDTHQQMIFSPKTGKYKVWRRVD